MTWYQFRLHHSNHLTILPPRSLVTYQPPSSLSPAVPETVQHFLRFVLLSSGCPVLLPLFNSVPHFLRPSELKATNPVPHVSTVADPSEYGVADCLLLPELLTCISQSVKRPVSIEKMLLFSSSWLSLPGKCTVPKPDDMSYL